jgi:hypothetical protein
MSGRRSIDSLRRLSPVSDADAAAVFGAAGREELLAGLTRLPVGRPRWETRPRRRSQVLALAAVLAVAATATAAWALLGSSARETTGIECSVDGTDTIIPATSGNPAHDCAVALRRDSGTAPPPLVAYDNTQGGVTVLPRSAKAADGWKPIRSQDAALIQLQESLDDYVAGLNSSCLDSAAATHLADAKLAQFGFTGWAVTVRSADGGTTSQSSPPNAAPVMKDTPGSRTCVTSDIVDPATQSVTLIPTSIATGTEKALQNLADKLRPLTQTCESLPAVARAVRTAANNLGLSESARTYELNAVTDNSLRCAAIYETVGGTIFLTVRGPSG